ncbi:MAG: class I SAM-dependent methyltransferase [Candidatus Staskawiczbacteria bacterium]|nr:class I SAM-dependent methyltransferase [Candidatus Staskawiczbacteria bacterium]
MNYFQKNKFFKGIIRKIKKKGAEDRIETIKPYLDKNGRILDIGAGSCMVSELLERQGCSITPIDVEDLSFAKKIKPIIYNGSKMPFKKDEFAASLVLTVLHHTPFPEKILKEAKRTSKKIIVIEDIYTNMFNKYLAYFIDKLLNLKFSLAHTNKKDREWKEIFDGMNLKLLDAKYHNSPFGVKRAIYCLEK